MIADLLRRFTHDTGWPHLAAAVLFTAVLALAVISYTAWSKPE